MIFLVSSSSSIIIILLIISQPSTLNNTTFIAQSPPLMRTKPAKVESNQSMHFCMKTVVPISLVLIFLSAPSVRSFTSIPCFLTSTPTIAPKTSRLHLNWFSNKKDERPRQKNDIGGVAQVMDSMEQLRKTQDVGKLTASILEELDGLSFQGSAADGKVRVIFDGQRRPKGVEIDDTFLASADADDLQVAITTAMKEAYEKSGEKMEEKMKALYVELGLSAN
jgi:DNA-binding YbaB/EbfC family protein